MEDIITTIKKAKNIWVCGNGGSSATAEHFTNDLFSKGIKAHCLNSNTSIITMIANDFGYEYIFSKQLDLFYKKGDLVIVFSVSGKSPNILNAIKDRAHIKFLGDEGESYGEAESKHLLVCHKISSLL